MIPSNLPARLYEGSHHSQIGENDAESSQVFPQLEAAPGKIGLRSGENRMTERPWAPALADLLDSELARTFGGVSFQVTALSSYDASSVEVAWTDGPPLYAVDVIIRRSAAAFEVNFLGPRPCLARGCISKRRTMSPEAEEQLLSLLGSALGIDEFDMERIHPTPPLLAPLGGRFTVGSVPEFLDALFEKTSFCTQCPAPASGGSVACPCIGIRN